MKERAIILLICTLLSSAFALAAEEPCLVVQNPLFSKLTIHTQDFVSSTLVVEATRDGTYTASTTLPNLHFTPSTITLRTGERGYFNTSIVGSEALPGAYVGTFNLTGADETQIFPIIIEVESETKGYDINLEVPPLYTNIFPGERLVFQTTLFNLYQGEYPLNAEPLDVTFFLYTATGRLVAVQEENIIVTDTTRLTKSFVLAEDSECTEYVIAAVVKSSKGESVGVATQNFRIVEKPSAISSYISANPSSIALTGIVLAILIASVILFIRATKN